MALDLGNLGKLGALALTLFLFGFLLLFMFVLIQAVIKSMQERRSDGGKLEQLEALIDQSLSRYRQCRKSRFGKTINWQCIAKLFTFHITLQRNGLTYILHTSFHFPLTTVDQKTANRFDTSKKLSVDDQVLYPQQHMEELFSRLQFFDSLNIHTDGVMARKKLIRSALILEWPKALSGMITFVRYLIDYEKRKDLKISGDAVCPYCRSEISERDDVVSCRVCRTFHHRDCWEEIDQCSVFGCKG